MIQILLLIGFGLMFFVIFACLALFTFCFSCLFIGKDFLYELGESLNVKDGQSSKE